MLDAIGRANEAVKRARARSRTVRMLNNLPPEVQKDIGWPAAQSLDDHQTLFRAVWRPAR